MQSGYGLSGLGNLGNTCFMNAAIQCLSNVPPLTNYLINSYDRINNTWVECAKNNNPLDHLDRFLLLQYARLIREIWIENAALAPKTFKCTLQRINNTFSGHRQHDSQEFLICLIDILHKALKVDPKKVDFLRKKENSTKSLEEKANKAWNKFVNTDGWSILIPLFWAQLCSVVVCQKCNNVSYSFDPYSYLSLSLPTTTTTSFDVTDCLSSFEKEECLEGQNSYECDHCEEKTTANKIMSIWSLPRFLLLHLKRFRSTSVKDNRAVSFPLDNFKLGDWAKQSKDWNAKYNLRAVCCHVGGIQSGHYYAYCRNPNGKWYKYDDTRVMLSSRDEILRLTHQPYYFIYERSK